MTWAIWKARNKAYFEKVQTQPKVILNVALALLVTYQMLSATQANAEGSSLFCWFREKPCMFFLPNLYG